MSIAVVADAHLGGPGGDGDELAAQLRELPQRGCRRLVLLGDIFHVWVGSRRFETPEVRKLMPVLRGLRDRGVRVDYIEGNRDFFLDTSPYVDAFDSIGLELSFEVGGRRVLAVHGDGLNDRDRQYRAWRWLSKSPPVRFLVLRLPDALAQRAVAGTEQRLAQTNFKHRDRLPEESIVAYGTRRLGEGHDLLLLGHFHEPRLWQLERGAVRVVDAWFRSRRVEWLGDESADDDPPNAVS
ncbi:MAG: UDP-2,3-diacylglucosamine diphosphatase [Acidobacteriota bacterium]